MPAPDFDIKAGDTSSSIYATCENSGGTPIDIEGATVRFRMAPLSGGAAVIDAAAVNEQLGAGTSDNSIGHVRYDWIAASAGTAGDTGTAGMYLAEWHVTYASGTTQSFPNSGYVLVAIAEAL